MGRIWQVSAQEQTLPFPCDAYLADPDDVYFRGIDIRAPKQVAFTWLCQLRVAPYSYDLIDNLGRRSPRRLIAGLDRLQVGQRVMTIFDLVEFDQDSHLTIRLSRARFLFGEVAGTYLLLPRGSDGGPEGPDGQGLGGRPEGAPGGCRLVVKLLMRHSRRLPALRARTAAMPWLDLAMMRKQLLTLKQLAEAQAP